MRKSNEKKWIQLSNYPSYEINEEGEVRNIRTKRVLKYGFQNSYDQKPIVTLFSDNGKGKRVFVETLVAENFVTNPNPLQFQYIIHKDGNIQNCRANNLRWSVSKKTKMYQADGGMKPVDYYTFFPLEEFPDCIYEINKVGQIRNKKTKNILKGCVIEGYLAYTLMYKGKLHCRLAHVLVAKQFLPNDDKTKTIINHKDENRLNSCVDNLEWVSISENSLYGIAQDKINRSRQKPINEYSIEGKFIRTWKSIKKLTDYLKTIYPNQSFDSKVRSVVIHNSQDNKEKIQLCNRVFIRNDGSCEDRKFCEVKKVGHKFDEYEMPELVENPDYYLSDDKYMKSVYLCALNDLIRKGSRVLNDEQNKAIKNVINFLSNN